MKELINIVNSKFQAVIDELKNQKNTLETKLKRIIEDIDKKVIIASKYKEDVEKSNNNISDLENEISKLKTDLKELQDKFESAGFTGIVEAANKEINGKIIDNNTKISEEKEKIKNYQDEVQNLKDELTTMKESKHNLEKELNNTNVALNYYSSRIDDITIYAIENSDKLEDYNKEPEEEPTEEVVNKDIDGDIFKDIDEIATGDKEISDEELNELLNHKYEDEEEESEEDKLTKTQMLDDVISKTQEIINNTKTEDDFVSLLDEDEENNVEEVTEEVTPVEEIKEAEEETPSEEPLVESDIVEEPTEEVIEEKEEPVSEDTSEIVEVKYEEEKQDEGLVEEPLVEETMPFDSTTVPVEESTEIVEDQPMEPVVEEQVEATVPVEEVKEESDVEKVPELTTVNFDAPIETEEKKSSNTFIPETDEVKETIDKLGLKYDMFDDNLKKITSIDYDNALRIIECLDLHFIDTDNIYKYPQILVTMKPDTLDKILDLLEQAGCVSSTFDYIFKYIDKIDMPLLQSKVKAKTDCIIGVLYDSIHNLDLRNISEVFSLTDEEAKMLESKVDAREYNLMCSFSDVVKANYDTLDGYHVADIKKCFTEHPKRFLLNPDVFDTILG